MIRFVFCAFATLFFLPSSAQFALAWQKPLGLSRDTMEYHELTCTQAIDGYHFIGYQVRINDKLYPGLSFISSSDSLQRFNNFTGNPDLDGYRIISFVKSAGDTLLALCNDEETSNGRTIHSPAFMKFSFQDGKLTFLDYYNVNLSDTAGVTDVQIVDGISAGSGTYYMAVAFHKLHEQFVNLYFCRNDKVVASQSVEKAGAVKLWWGDGQNLVLSSEVPFAEGSRKKYYQIMVLDENLAPVRVYPETLQYLDSNASDQLVTLSYRPAYHLGMVARQVRDLAGVHRMNWFGFNGYPNGTYNKLIGEDKNLLIVENVVHPKEEQVVFNYFYPGSGLNNWVVSTLHRPDLAYDNLILSIENFNGLELVRDTFGKATDDMIEKAALHPELLKNIGTGDIDQRYPEALCFINDSRTELYVVYNKPKKTLERAGLYISKFTLNTNDERLAADYLAKKYQRDIYYAKQPIAVNDTRKWLLVALAPDDPLYGQATFENQSIKLESAMTPVQNSWYWEGDVKIGRKKYHLTKAVLAIDDKN